MNRWGVIRRSTGNIGWLSGRRNRRGRCRWCLAFGFRGGYRAPELPNVGLRRAKLVAMALGAGDINQALRNGDRHFSAGDARQVSALTGGRMAGAAGPERWRPVPAMIAAVVSSWPALALNPPARGGGSSTLNARLLEPVQISC